MSESCSIQVGPLLKCQRAARVGRARDEALEGRDFHIPDQDEGVSGSDRLSPNTHEAVRGPGESGARGGERDERGEYGTKRTLHHDGLL